MPLGCLVSTAQGDLWFCFVACRSLEVVWFLVFSTTDWTLGNKLGVSEEF